MLHRARDAIACSIAMPMHAIMISSIVRSDPCIGTSLHCTHLGLAVLWTVYYVYAPWVMTSFIHTGIYLGFLSLFLSGPEHYV
jgi:hypothetical protein